MPARSAPGTGPKDSYTSPGRFLRSLAASAGIHGLVVAGLLAIVPARWVLGAGGGQVQRVALLELQETPLRWTPEPTPEEPPLDLSTEPLADPELLDVPWTRFVERFDLPDQDFEDPFGVPPTARGDLSWSVPEPVVEVVPVEEPPVPEAAPPVEPVVAQAEQPGRRDRVQAQAVAQPAPAYPRLSVRRGEEGTVVCLLHVDPDGTVTSVEILVSSGFARLDESAVESLSTWRFRPACEGGMPVPCTIRHEVVFRIED